MHGYCYACGAPLTGDFKGAAETYCRYCLDESGDLRPREDIRQGIAGWMRSWQPGLDEATALARADLYMRAMPAWAD